MSPCILITSCWTVTLKQERLSFKGELTLKKITLNQSLFFVLKMLSAFTSVAIYSCALQSRLFHGSKQYEP